MTVTGKKVYDSSLHKVILFADAVEMWEDFNLPNVPRRHDGTLDVDAASQDWSFFVDNLHRDGQISDWQNHNWGSPSSCDN